MLTRITCVAVSVLCVLSLSSSVRADRQAVERVLKSMQTAVLAGNGEDYLVHVAKDEPNFRKEQENWAKDLATHKPIAFTLAIADVPERTSTFGDSNAEFELVMSWTMPGLGEDGGNLTRTTSYPVRFAKDGESGAWLYHGERWLALEGTDAAGDSGASHKARALYLEGYEGVAKLIVEVLPEVRDRVHEGFELTVDRVQEIKVYPTMRHLQSSIYLSYTDPLSGWNEPKESIKLVVSTKAGKRMLRILLAHEYAHVATFEMGEKATDAPWWVLEGVAELAAEAVSGPTADQTVIAWAKRDRLEPWENLTDFRSVPGELHKHVYKQGQHMLAYLSERFGRSTRNLWLRAMSDGQNIDNASSNVLGISFAKLDADWRAEVARLVEEAKASEASKEAGKDTPETSPPSSEKDIKPPAEPAPAKP
jgi:hypothetical protein